MKYMWSKNRIAKYLLPIILKDRKPWQWYVEPFVWGANMIDKVDGNRIGADYNPYLIEALKFIRDNSEKIPKNNKEYTEEMFNKAKESNLENWLDCLAMFQYSFWAIFKWSWSKNKRWTDYVKECVSNNIKQSKNIQWVKFIHSSYWDLEIPKESIIYCDIPYKWTAKYKWVDEFNYENFYEWCREKKKQWHTIFISEYNMPDDFKCVWQQDIVNNLNNKKATEKLFTL